MATNLPLNNPAQRVQPGMMPQQPQHGVFHQQQQQPQMQSGHSQSQPQAQMQQQIPSQPPQANVDMDQKKLQDMIEAINLINNMRDDMNAILDNVAKANSANNYGSILAGKQTTKSMSESNSDQTKQNNSSNTQLVQQNNSVGTPASVSNPYSQSQTITNNNQTETEQLNTNEINDKFCNLDLDEQEFFEKTDNKYLLDKVRNINDSAVDLEKIIKDLQPVQMVNLPDFTQYQINSILLDQTNDERSFVTGPRLLNNYRSFLKLQENLNYTNLTNYKRYTQTYAEKKSLKYKSYSTKTLKKEDLEKIASATLADPKIKVVALQKTENQFVLDIIMPQNFKFVFLFFDSNVEKFQVRPLDSRILKIYANNKPSDEICYFDFDHKNKSNVFQRLEENCLFAILFFKTEYSGTMYFSHILKWIKNFKDLFNAKCGRCEKHLLNGVPPTWRDLKTYEPYHDECRIF